MLIQTGLGIGLILVLFATHASATVYGWKSEDGALHFSNDPGAVPETYRLTAEEFTSKLVGKEVPVEEAPPPPSLTGEPLNTYERGLERGLEVAERQVALAGELARSVVAATPARPPVRVIIRQSAPIVRYVSPGYSGIPFYGFVGPYAPHFSTPYYWASYAYGVGHGRFVPHSHFFPGTRGRHRGLFFPHGHFSQDGFLFGHGLVVR